MTEALTIAEQVRAIRGSAGAIDRTGRGLVRLRGADRVAFMQGMCTNDVATLRAGQGCYALHLSVKGKVIADMAIYKGEDWLLCETEAGLGAKLAQVLEARVVMEEVEIVDETVLYGVVAVHGPRAFEAAGTPPLTPYAHAPEGAGLAAGRDDAGERGVHLIVPRAAAGAALSRAIERGATPIAEEALDAARIEAGTPRYGVDFGEDTIPLEANLRHALSFTKGCYVGQEVIARATARGHVNWRQVGLVIEGEGVPAPGATAASEARPEAARITSACRSPTLARTIALAYVHRTVSDGEVLKLADGRAARVVALPFLG
ncbi:MAG: glycine cleavage T C-terminal barrel domain-containing protein [Myxococcota bacterium]